MAGGAPLRSNNVRNAVSAVVFCCLLLQGCARGAPALPDAQVESKGPAAVSSSSPNIPKIECELLDHRLAILDAEEKPLIAAIEADRGRNQVAGYFGGLFIFPLLAMKDHPEEKRRLDAIQVERDGIYAEKKELGCS